ncbi:hypothetical protein C5167_001065 [Papaver somniferum]|uniref:C2 tensin-type domain-containing protein n=1 Tax=Papaver somniferum TaxID=3469 RepID=A0A4Y7KYA4_PAPSO|nr:hypothetical protein C5167_001065 [Papaver somniferum]
MTMYISKSFRLIYNMPFVRSNILLFNREDINILGDRKKRFQEDFKLEVLSLVPDIVGYTIGDEDETLYEEEDILRHY